MKNNVLLVSLISLFASVACNSTPSIDAVQDSVADDVEALLTEDNNEDTYFRLDRFFLDANPEPLIFTGVLKATYFYKNRVGKWDSRNMRWITTRDSTKMYRNVTIRYRDKKYDHYTIEIAAPE